MSSLLLFDVEDFTSSAGKFVPISDPYWDEIVLDSSKPSIQQDGQTTLFYDDSEEPPDPDDFQSLEAYHQAFREWRSRYPNSEIQAMSVLEDEESVLSSLPEQKKWQWIEEYPVTRCRIKYWYFRYCWYERSARKIHHIHVPGGNSGSAIAISRKGEIEKAIAAGKSPGEIENLVKGGFKS
jgi:hypothetical protein